MCNIARLRTFVRTFTRLVEQVHGDEERVFVDGRALLADLVAHDDWLPEAFTQSDPQHYRQYLLHCDPLERFAIVSFVWAPQQQTPIHDHTVWGIVGVMRGTERCELFAREPGGRLTSRGEHTVGPGDTDLVSPRVGDIHQVSNARNDRASVSIHVYGGNIGAIRRHTYDRASGRDEAFVSGYSSEVVPNIWNRPETQEALH